MASKLCTELSTIAEGVVISTCNRMEVYVAAEDRQVGLEVLRQAFIRRIMMTQDYVAPLSKNVEMRPNSTCLPWCVALIRWCCGETEIFGQVKTRLQGRLFEAGATKGSIEPSISKSRLPWVSASALHTRIQMGATSVGNVAVDLAEKIFGKLNGSHVMIIGAGETSRLVAQSMISRRGEPVDGHQSALWRRAKVAWRRSSMVRSFPFDSWQDALVKADVDRLFNGCILNPCCDAISD